MPLCTIKTFEGEFTVSQAVDLIHRVTEAIIPFVGEKLRGNRWKVVRSQRCPRDAVGKVSDRPALPNCRFEAARMKIVSVNAGMPREILWKGMTVQTAIFKEPVQGPVMIDKLNLAGDRQADLTVHGGEEKAVYAYPVEHYAYWRQELPDVSFSWGMFGENLTTEGVREDSLCIGDRLKIGSAVLMVTQPRIPCYKLALRFDFDDMIKR